MGGMKVLHTSDWHLGVSADTAPRHEEHSRFLAWLLEQIRVLKVDVLILAGDVFHYTQPSAAAQSQFFEFLSECSRVEHLDVVVVAGNHDSPSRLDAPASVLKSLRIHVVGNLPERLEDALVHVERSGESLVIAAVPYVSESKLGVVTTDRKPSEIREIYSSKFAALYGDLADLAEALYPGVARMATGHLTCVGKQALMEGDFFTPIHQSLAISGLDPAIFGESYQYVALGHIHRAHRVSERVYYAGTPVATNITEAFSPRRVVLVEGEEVQWLEVPVWRESFVLRGTPDEVRDLVESLAWMAELPPYLYIDIEGEGGGPDVFQRVLAREFPDSTPRIASFRRLTQNVEVTSEDAEEVRVLDGYTPEEVFCLMWTRRFGSDPSNHELAAFRELLAEVSREEG